MSSNLTLTANNIFAMSDTVNLRNKKLPSESRVNLVKLPEKTRPARTPMVTDPSNHTPAVPPIAQTVSWHAPTSYHGRPRSAVLGSVGIIAFGAAALLAWQGEYLGGLVFLAGGLGLFLFGRTPTTHHIHIDAQGIQMNDALVAWEDLRSFWIDYRAGGTKELSLEFTHWYRPRVRVLLANQDPLAVRQILITHIPEQEHPISLIDFWSKRY
ncbi:MAG: hypothetical protein AAB864_02425 [Patescibacteria group bacterium]